MLKRPLLIVAALLLPMAALAAGYLKLGDIKGESTAQADDHKDWINLESWSFGETKATHNRPSAKVAGRAYQTNSPGHVTISNRVGKATPKLAESVCKGNRAMPTVTLDLPAETEGARTQSYIRYTLEEVTVSCTTSSGADGQPTEQIRFNYQKISEQPAPQKALLQAPKPARKQ